MAKYTVSVPEIWRHDVIVEADSEEEAIEKVNDGEGTEVENSLEYSSTLDKTLFYAQEVKE